MEKMLNKLLEEGANIGEKYILTAVLERHWKKATLAIGSLVYAVKAFIEALPGYLETLERMLAKHPFIVVVLILLCLWWIASKALARIER